MIIAVLLSIALATEFIVLDEMQEGFKLINGQICDTKGNCVPEVFVPSMEFTKIFNGQKVPKGLHITMDYTTGEKMGKILERTDTAKNRDITVVKGEELKPQAVIHKEKEPDPATNLRQMLTLEEKETLTGLFADLNTTKPAETISRTLTQLSDAAHHIDVGVGIVSNMGHVKHLILLLSHESDQVRARVSILFGTILSNNDIAQNIILDSHPTFIKKLVDSLDTESNSICKKRLLFALSAMLRGNSTAKSTFEALKPYNLLLLLAKDAKFSTKTFALINDAEIVFPPPFIDQLCDASNTLDNSEAQIFHSNCKNHRDENEL